MGLDEPKANGAKAGTPNRATEPAGMLPNRIVGMLFDLSEVLSASARLLQREIARGRGPYESAVLGATPKPGPVAFDPMPVVTGTTVVITVPPPDGGAGTADGGPLWDGGTSGQTGPAPTGSGADGGSGSADGGSKQSPTPFDGKGAGAWLEKWENRKAKAYPDPNGRDTDIGVGYNLTGNGDQARADLAQLGLDYAQVLAGKIILTDAQIDSLLLLTMNRARDAAQRLFPNFGQMNTDQQIAVVDALFAFGASGFLDQFPKTVAALRAGDFATAAKELSDWKDPQGRGAADAALLSGPGNQACP